MKVLVVFAHPERRSFNGQMRDAAIEALTAAGHEVRQSDLYAMEFEAVAGRHDFDFESPEFFHLQTAQDRATREGKFVPEIGSEQEKLLWADFVLFQFPLWWQSVPAILKGWFDRVLARGFAYGGGRMYESGPMRGKRAMCALTTGGSHESFTPEGFYQRELPELLRHVLHGTLQFVGFEVLPPYVAWSAAKVSDEERGRYLRELREAVTRATMNDER